ncbi:MAG: hypothetical protein K6A70_04085 [Erysipelotrichaceae bacterium]|nr:hypothetical protein [Erysipelotrichaceae bacterium]
MHVVFPSQEIPVVKVKNKGTIKAAVDKYRSRQTPMKQLLTDYLAVKSYGDRLAEAENPWAYYYKGIEGHEIEMGVSYHETLFNLSTMSLKKELPTDVIDSAFYTNNARNDYDFELGYLVPLFINLVKDRDNILVVNPSPKMIINLIEALPNRRILFSVTDETVAKLYHKQFTDYEFFPFEKLDQAENIDAVLIANRDQKTSSSGSFLRCLRGCNDDAFVVGLIPSAWFDSDKNGISRVLEETIFTVHQLLMIDPSATNTSPKKKEIVILEKGNEASNIEVKQTSFDVKTRMFTVLEDVVTIDSSAYIGTDATIISLWNEALKEPREVTKPVYSKSQEFKFSEEISLFYRVYSNREGGYRIVASYREIKEIEPKKWGKTISKNRERILRSKSSQMINNALSEVVFDDEIYPWIRSDIARNYIGIKPLTLKSIWVYCWSDIVDSAKYDHGFMVELFANDEVSRIIPQSDSALFILKAMALLLKVDVEDISYQRVEQINHLFVTAMKANLIQFNPMESYVAEYTSRASERQQDVRNALVKKHFSDKEEMFIFLGIVGLKSSDRFLCTEKSLLLAAAIRLFTGMSIREVSALNWKDFRKIKGTEDYQLLITKFVDRRGRIQKHAEKNNWNRFRIIPVARVLSYLLLDRKKYLLDMGIDKDYLEDCPIVLSEENIKAMKAQKRVSHCKPDIISRSGKELIKLAKIPENRIVLPDEKNDLVTDFNKYHGDIFQTNFKDKTNHKAYLTLGEINYMFGIDAPDTFSRHYCDYTNDFVQLGIIQKLSRWELEYERMISGIKCKKPSFGHKEGDVSLSVGPFDGGVATIDILIENRSGEDSQIVVSSEHGLTVNSTSYGVDYDKDSEQ